MEMLRTQNYVTEMFYFRDKPGAEEFLIKFWFHLNENYIIRILSLGGVC
jgi:hypothetical protein